jgi:hypothetical protein
MLSGCYSGPEDTKGIGACQAGTTTCGWNLVWSPCVDEVVPTSGDNCLNLTDDDCDELIDEGIDVDGDGWGGCNGDCCETPDCASDPKLVNPGAFEAGGNTLDDDCDGMVDNVDPDCEAGNPQT